jgi:acetolactate decarboxylase
MPVVALLLATALAWSAPRPGRDVLFQYSLFSALQTGLIEGELTCRDLRKHGDFGIGTFNGLDGEMIVSGGRVYRVSTDGVAREADKATRIPYAAVTFFDREATWTMDGPLDLAELQQRLDALLPSRNLIYAVGIDAACEYAKTRSIPRQTAPGATLADALKGQVTFEGRDVTGKIVGFRLPAFLAGVNVTGYHLHFLGDGGAPSGHLLECRFRRAVVTVDLTPEVRLVLPDSPAFRNAELKQ